MRFRFVRGLMAAVLVALATVPAGTAHADPAPPYRTLPICGDQGAGVVDFNCDDVYELIPEIQTFRVPEGVNAIDLDFVFDGAAYPNSLFVYRVSGVDGSVGSVEPGSPAYPAAVAERAQEVFPPNSSSNFDDVRILVDPGDLLAFGIDNGVGSVFYSVDSANPDRRDHFIGFNSVDRTQFGFEDTLRGGDNDFDDVVFTVSPPLTGTSTGRFVHVALGDSFASGEGTSRFTSVGASGYENGSNYDSAIDDNTLTGFLGGNGCHRSLSNYAKVNDGLIEPALDSVVVDRTCSGAELNLTSPSPIVALDAGSRSGPLSVIESASQANQALFVLDQLEISESEVDLVTISAGGNDVEFADFVRNCVAADVVNAALNRRLLLGLIGAEEVALAIQELGPCAAASTVFGPGADGFADLPTRLDNAYADLNFAFPSAEVLHVNYPIFAPDGIRLGDSCGGLTGGDTDFVRDVGNRLNSIIESAVLRQSGQVQLVDVSDSFGSNPLCPVNSQLQMVNGLPDGAYQGVYDRIFDPSQEPGKWLADATSVGALVRCSAELSPLAPFFNCSVDDSLLRFVEWFDEDGIAIVKGQLAGSYGVTDPSEADAAGAENVQGLFHPNQRGVDLMACAVRATYHDEPVEPCEDPKQVEQAYTFGSEPIVDNAPLPVEPGQLISFEIDGWSPSDLVGVVLHSAPIELGDFVANPSGKLAGSLQIPADASPGVHRIVFRGYSSTGQVRSVTVFVELEGSPSPGDLYGLMVEGFEPFDMVEITWLNTPWGRVRADRDGRAFLEVLMPEEEFDGELPLLLEGELSGAQPVPVEMAVVDDSDDLGDCDAMVIDSFLHQPYTFTFQIRNATADALSFEFVIPEANYALDNLVLNGSVSNVEYSSEIDPDGSYRHTVAGLVPPYQSVGGYQPDGFGGQLQPDSAEPLLRCGVA